MVSFFLGFGLSLYYLFKSNQTPAWDCGPSTPGSNPARIYEISFFLKN